MLQRPRATRPCPSRVVMRLTLESAPTRSSGSDSGYPGDRQLGLRRAHGVLRSFRDVRYSPRVSLRCATGTPRQQQAGWRLQARTISPRLTLHPQSVHDISMRSGYRTTSKRQSYAAGSHREDLGRRVQGSAASLWSRPASTGCSVGLAGRCRRRRCPGGSYCGASAVSRSCSVAAKMSTATTPPTMKMSAMLPMNQSP